MRYVPAAAFLSRCPGRTTRRRGVASCSDPCCTMLHAGSSAPVRPSQLLSRPAAHEAAVSGPALRQTVTVATLPSRLTTRATTPLYSKASPSVPRGQEAGHAVRAAAPLLSSTQCKANAVLVGTGAAPAATPPLTHCKCAEPGGDLDAGGVGDG